MVHSSNYYTGNDPVQLYTSFIRGGGAALIKEVNRNFKIKIYGYGLNKLIGVYGLVSLIGIDLASDLIHKALANGKDIYSVRLRRGLKIDFYSY